MKEHWERTRPVLQLDLDVIAAMVQPVFAGRRVLGAELLSGGLANTNYRIAVSGYAEAFVLRVYTRDPTAACREMNLYRAIGRRVPMPEILHVDPEGRSAGVPYAVMRYVEGIRLGQMLARGGDAEIASAAEDVGAVLARIGTLTFPQAGFLGPDLTVDEPFGDSATLFVDVIKAELFGETAIRRLDGAFRERLWRAASASAPCLWEIGKSFSLVHADFNDMNILMRLQGDAWRVAAVLDWEFAFASSPLFDVGNMLRGEERMHPAFEPSFIRSFAQNGGALPAEWKRIAKLLDLVSLCQFLNMPDLGPAAVADVIDLLRATLGHLER